MRKIAEIRKDLKAQIDKVNAMDRNADPAAYAAEIEKAAALTKELEQANTVEEANQRLAEKNFQEMEKEAKREFSLIKFIREAAAGNLTGLEAEVAELGAEEYRRLGLAQRGFVIPTAALRASSGQNATTNADGGYAKVTMPLRYVDSLKERLVISRLGATILGDLVGTVPLVSAGKLTASWLAEGAQATTSKATFASATMTPHRNAVVAAFSKDLLRQTSQDVENMLRERILDAHAELLETAAISGTGSSNQPTGILNTTGIGSVAMGANGGAITWAKVVDLETAVRAENGLRGSLGYLTNAKVWGAMKQTPVASGFPRFILDGDYSMLNGHRVEWSNLVPSNLTKGNGTGLSPMIFGNWEDLYIGQWGGIDIVVDPFTLAEYADVRIVLNAWNDVEVAVPDSFAAIVDINA